jgi:hypothetical protein
MEVIIELVLKLLPKLEVDTKEGAREILLLGVHLVRLMAFALGVHLVAHL